MTSTAAATSTGCPVYGTSTSATAAASLARRRPGPGFLHAIAPNQYRLGDNPAACTRAALASIEALVEQEGAETVAAVIAEPVQGAGGVIVPPDDYFRGLRDLCDRYDLYLIA